MSNRRKTRISKDGYRLDPRIQTRVCAHCSGRLGGYRQTPDGEISWRTHLQGLWCPSRTRAISYNLQLLEPHEPTIPAMDDREAVERWLVQ